MEFLITSFSLVRLPDPSQHFRRFPDLVWGAGQNYNFRVVLYGRLAKKKKKGIGRSFFGLKERLLSPTCHKRLPIRRLEVASQK